MAHQFYVAVVWEDQGNLTDEQAAALDEAVIGAVSNYPFARMTERSVLVGVQGSNEREQLYGVLLYLAKGPHTGEMRFGISPPIAAGATWAGFLESDRWPSLRNIAKGQPPEDEG